ncbi:MAG: hypothetical protein KME60_11755 [Cyanomargarita calcarea GSE-NOS-MK-12-04C]|jgi:hypothetical protein|uniref:Uncharacterized protein n=1 Tax=Cyanomargarita calcarea GSE-NOS-MK-12-04C TaxID=2839659 RepID=A0A951URX1_9CYAN|nr:hypothetical protein [Cyanomargarita calcarea GSE-NOS-MK-12-04C]
MKEEGRRKKEEGRRKKEEGRRRFIICEPGPQLKISDPKNGRGINKNSEG